LRVLVTGANGQLGRELSRLLPERGHETVPLARADLDITDPAAVEEALREHAPHLVANTAAFNAVDACEARTEEAHLANALGPRNLAVACERRGAALLQVSTNYVFDGRRGRPYEPFDAPNPLSAYGRSKLGGEEYVKHLCGRWYVVRTAAVYGEGGNFVRTMLRLAGERESVKVKEDEYVQPTYAKDLAGGIAEVFEERGYGVYHLTNGGSCSWHELAEEVFRLAGVGTPVAAIPAREYPTPAERPANGVLSGLGGPRLRHWREALKDYLAREGVLKVADG
jgi:dTDP-4-dehydrorhamnose reductase